MSTKKSRRRRRSGAAAKWQDHKASQAVPERMVRVRVRDEDWTAFRALCVAQETPAAHVLGLLVDRYVRTKGRF